MMPVLPLVLTIIAAVALLAGATVGIARAHQAPAGLAPIVSVLAVVGGGIGLLLHALGTGLLTQAAALGGTDPLGIVWVVLADLLLVAVGVALTWSSAGVAALGVLTLLGAGLGMLLPVPQWDWYELRLGLALLVTSWLLAALGLLLLVLAGIATLGRSSRVGGGAFDRILLPVSEPPAPVTDRPLPVSSPPEPIIGRPRGYAS